MGNNTSNEEKNLAPFCYVLSQRSQQKWSKYPETNWVATLRILDKMWEIAENADNANLNVSSPCLHNISF